MTEREGGGNSFDIAFISALDAPPSPLPRPSALSDSGMNELGMEMFAL